MAIRVQGKAGFAQLQQAGQRMQLYVRKDDVGEDGFALYKLLDLGDHIGARGFLFRTRTGELTCTSSALTFLAKAMLALPDKFHGLEDTELRYRQRYVDLFVNPEVRDVFVKRAAVLRAMRKFFDARGYLEVETPMMQPIAGGAAAQALHDPPQRARSRPLSAHRAGALSQAPGGRRPRPRLRDQPQLPQRGHLHPAQSRVHHAGVLPGLRQLPRPDGPDRGVVEVRRAGSERHDRSPNFNGVEIDSASGSASRCARRSSSSGLHKAGGSTTSIESVSPRSAGIRSMRPKRPLEIINPSDRKAFG